MAGKKKQFLTSFPFNKEVKRIYKIVENLQETVEIALKKVYPELDNFVYELNHNDQTVYIIKEKAKKAPARKKGASPSA